MRQDTESPPTEMATDEAYADEAYEHFKHELHGMFRSIRKGHSAPPLRLGDLTPAESEVVMAISHAEAHGMEVRPGLLAHMASTTPSALSQTLKALEQKGHVVRTRLGTDSRGVVLDLTESGRALAGEGERMRDSYFRSLFAFLGKEDAGELLRIMGRVASFVTENRKEK